MSKEEFLLKWNNHQNNFVDVFDELLQNDTFIDVTLVCRGEPLSGHRIVLAACSPLFRKILQDNPCKHPVLILNDIKASDMRAILDFVYKGEVSIVQTDLVDFLKAADNLQIKGLAENKEAAQKRKLIHEELEQFSEQISSMQKRPKITSNCDTKTRLNDSISRNSMLSLHSSQSSIIECTPNTSSGNSFTSPNIVSNILKSNDDYPTKVEDSYITIVKEEPDDNHCLPNSEEDNEPIKEIYNSNNLPNLPYLTPRQEKSEYIKGKCNPEEFYSLSQNSEESLIHEAQMDGSLRKMRPGNNNGRKVCNYCAKTFCDNYTLRRHIMTHISRERHFECPFCQASYTRKDHLLAHVRRKHQSVINMNPLPQPNEASKENCDNNASGL